jgi:hypothetical protein
MYRRSLLELKQKTHNYFFHLYSVQDNFFKNVSTRQLKRQTYKGCLIKPMRLYASLFLRPENSLGKNNLYGILWSEYMTLV